MRLTNDQMRCAHRSLGELTRAMWHERSLLNSGASAEAPPSVSATPPAEAPKETRRAERREAARELAQFRVILHNDNHTAMDHVVRSIVALTPLPRSRAQIVMLMAHTRGVALVLITHRERAELYQQQFRSKGLTVTIEPIE